MSFWSARKIRSNRTLSRALESFDAAGRWREKYIGLSRGRRHTGERVDSSGTLPDGREFESFAEFRDLIESDPRPLARNLAEKLLTYGTGATVTFADREVVEAIVAETADDDYAIRSKPEVEMTKPVDISNPNDLIGRQRTMCDVIKLALQTDSTRFITFHVPGAGGVVPIDGVEQGYHALSHHGRDEEKLAQLAIVETALLKQWGDFLRELHQVDEPGGTLLDHTAVFMTSNLGNGSNHDNRNMPVLLAGGGFRHGGHLAFDRKNNYPLPNLYVSVLQQLGLEVDQFATSTGTMKGLEPVG